jgi:caffeoyl-CoA O-methyltransferase
MIGLGDGMSAPLGNGSSRQAVPVEAVIARLEADPEHLRRNLALPREAARLLYLITRIGGYRNLLEIGTAIGYSTLHLAWAAAENHGHVVSIDAIPELLAQTSQHLEEAGLTRVVSLRRGDALSVLQELANERLQFDLMFLDANKKDYLNYFRFADVLVSPGGVLIADNTHSHRRKMMDFIEALQTAPGWQSCDIDTPNGFILARREASLIARRQQRARHSQPRRNNQSVA